MHRSSYRNPRGRYRGAARTRAGAYRGGSSSSNNPRGRAGPFSSNPAAPRGVFEGGIWKCNCTPRLVAEHFKVRKGGRNQGRWFWTCQLGEGQRCDFFLWDEDARVRMEGAVLGGSRDEVRVREGRERMMREMQDEGNGEDERAGSKESGAGAVGELSRKRSAVDADLDDAEPWALTGEEEVELWVEAAGSSVLETPPRKAQKMGVYATPSTSGRRSPRKLPWVVQEPVTPTTTKASRTVADYFTSATKTKEKKQVQFIAEDNDTDSDSDDDEEEERKATQPPSTPRPEQQQQQSTPTLPPPTSPSLPTRQKDALSHPADAASSLSTAVLATLAPLNLPAETLTRLRRILSTHDLKTQGVTRGRDISRLALKAKEAKIVELQARIASLEAERERDCFVAAVRRGRDGVDEEEEEEEEEEDDDEDEEL